MEAKTAQPRSSLDLGRTCWRIEQCSRAALIVDAADYFRLVRQAMLKAKQQILMIGWDFDTRIHLDHDSSDEAPAELGAFLSWLPDKQPGLHIYMLKWDVGAIKLLGRGTTVLRIARWAMDKDISFKLDGAHPTGASHHHKIVVIDDVLAFCGGIDITAERWDTRDHRDRDERRKRPTTRRHYGPWHDATMAVDGDAARALGELARERWKMAGGQAITPPNFAGSVWPDDLDPNFQNVRVAVSRTRGGYRDCRSIREIEALFVDQIRNARNFVYVESQYFASRTVAAAIVERLERDDSPEFIIVNPKSGEGWLDEEAMSPARARLLEQIGKCAHNDKFRIYTPVTARGDDIYVHSKILIADDRLIRVGSANLNNRSMGLDSECDLTLDTALDGNGSAVEAIARFRDDLIAEHLDVEPEKVRAEFERSGSLIETIETLRGEGRTLVPFVPERPNQVEKAVADSELLDPESDGDRFEPLARPGLLAGVRDALHLRRQRGRR